MKKALFIAVLIMAVAAGAWAFDPGNAAYTSDEKTADALILTGAGYFHQIVVMPDGSNDVTFSIYDNTSATGTEILPTLTFAGDGGAQASPPVWVSVDSGIYVDITTAGTVAYVILYRGK
jgi:hypothetical protein